MTGWLQLVFPEAWLMDCTGFVTVSPLLTVPATASHWLHCLHADARTGEHCRLPRHCFQTARCHMHLMHWQSSTAMATVDLRLWRSSLDWLSKVMWSPLAKLPKACALQHHWALQWESWTLAGSPLRCLPTVNWITGFVLEVQSWGHCRCTGQDALHWWTSMSHWYWSLTTLHCIVFSLLALCTHWRATLSILRKGSRHTLPSTDCTWTTAGPLELSLKMSHWLPSRAALVLESDCLSLQRTWWSHCRWNWTATRSLVALQRIGWSLHPHCEPTATDAWWCDQWLFLAEHLHWWATAKEEQMQQTEDCPWRHWSRRPHCQGRCEDHWTAHWIWGGDCGYHWSLRLSMTSWSLMHWFWTLLCWLMYWSLESRFTEYGITCILHHDWWALFRWFQAVFITDLQAW